MTLLFPLQLRFTTGPSLNFNFYDQKSALNGVMTISSKALHNRLGDKERTPGFIGLVFVNSPPLAVYLTMLHFL